MQGNEKAERLLERVVRAYSPSGKEGKVAELLLGYLRGSADKAWKDAAGNALAMRGKGRPHILLTSHMDTVPGEIEVCKREGKLWGRGSVDAKGSLCALAEAFRTFEGKGTMLFAGMVEEEKFSKGANFLAGGFLKKWKPDFAINGEPSGAARITLGYKGCVRFGLKMEKRGSISGKTWESGKRCWDSWTR